MQQEDNIKVYVRIRPLCVEQQPHSDFKTALAIHPDQKTVQVFQQGLQLQPEQSDTLKMQYRGNMEFQFDQLGDVSVEQSEVFESIGKPIVDNCLEGYNGSIIAYGQTGSGKTFTMQGNEYETGLIQRTFDYLFQRTRNQPVSYEFKITYCEIYNETVYDLMNPYNTSSITIREDISRGMVYVDGLLEEYVSSADEAIGVFLRGEQNRHVGETSMNRESSRSHSIFTLSIVSKVHNDEIVDVRESRLNLVDLAGSERQKSSQTAGVRLKEAGNINKSLLALGNVINALVDISNGKQRHVQYRDSKLTFLLRDSLGGNAKTAIIGNVNPNHSCVSETISTLRFCARAKEIKTQAVVNVTYEGNVLELQEEIRRLRHELIRYKSVQNANGHLTSQEMPQEQKDLDWVYELYQLNKDEIELNCVNKLLLNRLVESYSEVKTLAEEIKEMEKVIESQKNLIQTERMKLKFKESTIDRMKASSRSTATSLDSGELHAKVAELEALNAQLEYINENHPKVNSFAAENMKLRNMLSAIDYKFTQYEAMKKMSVEANKYESLLLQLLENAKAALPKETVQVSSKADKNLISFLDVTLQDVKRELSYYQNICVDYEDMIQTKFHPEIGDLEAKLVYYKFKEMNSSRKINQMTATLQLSQQDNADLLSDLEDLNNEIIQLQASVKEKDNEISALKHEIEQIYRTHEAEMDSVKKQSHEIQNALLAAHSQISSLEEQKKQFCDRISELEQTKMALEISVRSKEYELKEAKEDIGSLKQDLSSFKESQEHFASSHQQNIQEKEEQVKSLMVEMEDKSAILDSQAKSIESLDETNKSLTQENAQLKKDLVNTRMELDKYKGTLSSLSDSIDKIKSVELENKTLEQKFLMILKRNEELEEANGNLVKHNNFRQKLQYHLQIKQENNLLRQENQRLQLELEKWRNMK